MTDGILPAKELRRVIDSAFVYARARSGGSTSVAADPPPPLVGETAALAPPDPTING